MGESITIHLDEAAARTAGFPGLAAPPAAAGVHWRIGNPLAAHDAMRKPPPGAIIAAATVRLPREGHRRVQ